MTGGLLAFLAALGGVVGSFSASLGLRLAAQRPWALGRSRCEACERGLSYAETLPVIGYVQARGRCRTCASPIDLAHPSGEVLGLVLLPSAVLSLGPMDGALAFLLGMTLLAASVADQRSQQLPDRLTAASAVISVLMTWRTGAAEGLVGLAAAIITVAVLQAARWWKASRSGDPGLGFGDVKLCGALALWLGIATPWAIALASALALTAMLIKRPVDGRLAFGPFLAFAGFATGFAREIWR